MALFACKVGGSEGRKTKVLVATVDGTYDSNNMTNVDCTHVTGYNQLTVDDFIFIPETIDVGVVPSGGRVSNITITAPSYDASTGIYSIQLNRSYNSQTNGYGIFKMAGKLYAMV